MFRIESYVTPIILNHVAKYVKNIRPQDAQVSLWEGEVAFQNLDLRLDVLEEELNLPFELLSGHIHELAIQVPWTKITSEPIRITINTIEFVLKLKDVRADGAGSSAGSSPQRKKSSSLKRKRSSKMEEQAQQSPGAGLVNKIINNIVVECHNIIIKYVEDDIVVSMNVQLLKYGSADEQWNYAMVDVHPVKVIMRKLIQISDLTICLDKRNSAGQIDVCQEPILYRCTLECRILRKYNIYTAATTSLTRVGLLTKSMDINVSSLQFPMAMRLLNLLLALKSGKVNNVSTVDNNEEEQDDQDQATESNVSMWTWAWNLLPSFTFEPLEAEESADVEQIGHTMDIGVYIEQLNFNLKQSELITDTIMGASKRIRYTPIVRITLGGIYCENVSAEENAWSNIKAGVSSICVEPLGSYAGEENETTTLLIETQSFDNSRAYIDKSLFDDQSLIAERGWGVTNYKEYAMRITDEYLLYRSPILAFDTVDYKAGPDEDVTDDINKDGNVQLDRRVLYRLLSAGFIFRYNQQFLQVKHIINDLIDSYDYPAYYAEKLDAAQGNSTPKLHPPLMEDYDALMQYIPFRKYKFDLKKIYIEIYAKCQSESTKRGQRRLSASIKQTIPNFLLCFEQVEGMLSTPLQPDKLVHTTCQLPEKPQQLIDACYDNYRVELKDFSLSLVHKSSKPRTIKLFHIPRLQLTYGSLLQTHLWKSTAVAECKLEILCPQFLIEFSKRELIASERLFNCILQYKPYVLLKLANQVSRPVVPADLIKMQNQFNELRIKLLRYQKHAMWHASLKRVQAELFNELSLNADKKNVIITTAKRKWLEFQAQFPCAPYTTDEETSTPQLRTAIALWIQQFNIRLDGNVIDFLRYQEEPDFHFQKDSLLEPEIYYNTQNLIMGSQNAATTATYVSAQATQTHVQPQLYAGVTAASLKQSTTSRRFSRNSQPTRKISHPEETVHFSSERDEKHDFEVTSTSNRYDAFQSSTQFLAWLQFAKSLILNIEIAQGYIEVCENFQNNQEQAPACETNMGLMRILLPSITCKSTHAEVIERGNLESKIELALLPKHTLNWTILLSDFAMKCCFADTEESILQPIQTTITIALTHRKEKNKNILRIVGTTPKEVVVDTLPPKHNVVLPPEKSTSIDPSGSKDVAKLTKESIGSVSPDGRSYSSRELAGELNFELSLKPSIEKSFVALDAAAAGAGTHNTQTKKQEKDIEVQAVISKACKRESSTILIYTLNVHADTTPIHFTLSMQKTKLMQEHIQLVLNVVQLLQAVAYPNASSDVIETQAIKIVTSAEENPTIKEFLDLETNSEVSVFSEAENTSLTVLSLFYQWTITRIIIELKNMEHAVNAAHVETQYNNKIIVELEDLLATVDKRDDFTKYTSKMGQFNLNYYELNPKGEWKAQECLRIKMLGEATNLPFCNVIVTCVGVKSFHKRIGVKSKGNSHNCKISEILVTMQAMEIILDMDKILEFTAPLCILCDRRDAATTTAAAVPEEKSSMILNPRPITVADMLMVHLDSKGFTLYLPVKTQMDCCSVVIFKIENIKITPNLENPLQRNPVRSDVFGKAAQMGILGTPGSLIEDRQYELTLRNMSAASGNWKEILTHMHEQAINQIKSNPAFEWNNQNRKTSLQLTEIFNNFNFVTIFAPCIVYNNILICGQAIEFNCASDFVASLNVYQLNLFSCLILRSQQISQLINDILGTSTKRRDSSSNLLTSTSSIYLSKHSSTTVTATATSRQENASFKSLNSPLGCHCSTQQQPHQLSSTSKSFIEAPSYASSAGVMHNSKTCDSSFQSLNSRRISTAVNTRFCSSAFQFRGIEEDSEQNVKTDSGFHSFNSRSLEMCNSRLNSSKERFASLTGSTSMLHQLERSENAAGGSSAPLRYVPHTISFVAGIFLIKFFDMRTKKTASGVPLDPVIIPLFSFTISQPSFMVTQNVHDSITQVSLFNLNICMNTAASTMAKANTASPQQAKNFFPDIIFDTRSGELSATGIPPPLVSIKMHRTKMQLLEIDAEVMRPIVIMLIESTVQQLFRNFLIIYQSLLENTCFDLRPKRAVKRGSKIKLMRLQCFNADRLHFKCDHIAIHFSNVGDYSCQLVCTTLKANMKFLTRPEKATIRASIGACYFKTNKKIFMHPICMRLSADFVSEPWNRLPIIIASAKLNAVQLDIGIYSLLQMRQVIYGFNRVSTSISSEWQLFLQNRPPEGVDEMQPDRLTTLKIPSITHSSRKKKGCKESKRHRVEFYQDDLRAGAFQFVELVTDAFLPLPYQIQIIKKNYGIICWRYPQPRKICKIHIFPVPMPVSKPIHIKCRMEYFSEANECFLHYCDFWLSETVSKQITLPEREICANIWRVVILQSLVSVNGECFDPTEEDDELHSIVSMKLDEVLNEERKETDFILHPKALVGCMRIDTSFQSESVPKVQFLISCGVIEVKLLNQPDENAELPSLLKKFRLAQSTLISQAFLVFVLKRINFHASFYTYDNFTLNSSLNFCVKYLDHGYLNMLYLLEEATLQSYVHVNRGERSVIANMVLEKLRINFGPSVIHSLLSSKLHWEELLDVNETRPRHALIPKCIVINRMHSHVSFGQTGTAERIQLQPKECHLYSFRSDYHSQELTFFIVDRNTQMIEASQSVPISLRLSTDVHLQHIRIGNKCIVIKSRRLSATQIFLLIKGQIELISMVPHNLRLQFRRESVNPTIKLPEEFEIDSKTRTSFYRTVLRTSNINMRLRLASNKGKARTGDIPLRTNKNLPWLVKVPTDNNSFISFWVRILRDDIEGGITDKFQPQIILITIWPIFELCSVLSVPVIVEDITAKEEEIELFADGGQQLLNLPATHLTEHNYKFTYQFPTASASEYTLSLKNLDWNKFFYYDDKKWTIDNALHELGKGRRLSWAIGDSEELRIKRCSYNESEVSVNYKCAASREFSCTLQLKISAWGMFVNATGLDISICDYLSKKRLKIESSCVEMMFAIQTAFTVDAIYGSNWVASMPIYFAATAGSANGGRHYILNAKTSIDIVILRGDDVLKFILELHEEDGYKMFKLRSKFVVTNFTKAKLCVLPFAMDHKESAARAEVATLDARVRKVSVKPVESLENCIGLTLDCFHDLNSRKVRRSIDTAFVWVVCIKTCDESDISIPIPLSMPFTRRCISIQHDSESMPLVLTLIEKDGIYYLNIFKDISPAILINNQTDMNFIVAQTSASENSRVTNTTPEYDGRHFEWFQQLLPYSKCYYTPPEMYANFPDVESTMCNLTLALSIEKLTQKNIKWSKPIRTDKTWEKFLHIPNHGDVKVIICDKHRIIRVSIFYIAQPLEFSVKDLRSRLLTPHPLLESDNSENSITSVALRTEKCPVDNSQVLPSTKCIHFLAEDSSKTQLKIRLFVKEIVFSFHTDSKERDCMKSEIFGMYVDDFMVAYDDVANRRQLNAVLSNLQIDNQLYSTGKYDFPVVLCGQNLYQRTAMIPQVHYLEYVYEQLLSHTPMALFTFGYFEDELKLSSVDCNISPIRTYIEDSYLNDLLDVLVDCEPSNCVYRPINKENRLELQSGETLLPREITTQALCISEPLQLRSFRIEPLSVLISVHTSVRLYIALDHSPLSFSTYERKQILTVPLRFGQSLGMHYLSGAIFGAGWVVGSLEILGSPSCLARSFSTGLRDFVSMPVEGLFRGPWGFVVGITQGSASLFRNVTAGTVNSLTKLASSVARNLDRLTLDQEHIERTEALRRLRPQGFTEGFSQGVTGLGISILGAVGGIARHTLEARSPAQVVTGMGKGIVGAFAKPISGAAELVALTGQGVLHTVGFNAMPEQRCPSIPHNMAVDPSGYRIWKLLPGVLDSDQILFYGSITLFVQDQPIRGYAVLTSTVFAIIEAQWDKLSFVFPVDKIEVVKDAEDKTLFYVNVVAEKEDLEEDLMYTNQRIMNFLHSSFATRFSNDMTTDSLNDLLQTHNERKSLSWSFHIVEILGDHLIQYLKIINRHV